MKHLARIFLLISGTLLLAYYLPAAWHILTATRIRVPFIQYSDTGHGFLLARVEYNETTKTAAIHYTDTEGRSYERGDFEKMLPLTYYYQLYKDGTMPGEINGVKITSASIQREMWKLRLSPDELDTPSVPLYTLFEAESGRVRLDPPDDFMRIRADGRIQFINPKSNKILAEKSARYTEAFARASFAFPAAVVGANPTPLKPYDEGVYLADAEGRIHRLRQVKGAPELIRIADIAADPAAWRALRPQHIIVNEVETHELRALIIDTAGQTWLAVGENYTLIKLPAAGYSPATDTLVLRANLLSRLVLVQTPGKITAIALDRDYEVLDTYEENLPTAARQSASKIARILFPFHWWLHDNSSGYYGFNAEHNGVPALAFNAFILVAYTIFLLIRRQFTSARLPDLAVVAVAGIFGLMSALLLPRVD